MGNQAAQSGAIQVGGSAVSRASASAVFALLKDSSSWPSWSMFVSSGLERPGDDDLQGVGAIPRSAGRESS
jgi:hypothetical protein